MEISFDISINDLINGIYSIISILSVCGFFVFIRRIIQHKHIIKELAPGFSRYEINKGLRNFIPTNCQNLDPSSYYEPIENFGHVVREKLTTFFFSKVFNDKIPDKFYIVLADSGMGKTTFLINIYSKYSAKIFKKYNIYLFPLGLIDVDDRILKINKPENAVLLLDALDEDFRAQYDRVNRIKEIAEKFQNFQCVIITCRSQFFREEDEIKNIKLGVLNFGTDKGNYAFKIIYISPFDQSDIRKYITKKYSLFQLNKRRKALKFTDGFLHLLAVRPMILSYIDDFMDERRKINYLFQVYEHIIEKWILRERVENKVDLRLFCIQVAKHIFENYPYCKSFFIEEEMIKSIIQQYSFDLSQLDMKSRSLLNRDVHGNIKFAHKSILEYLLTLEMIHGNLSISKDFDFYNFELISKFSNEIEDYNNKRIYKKLLNLYGEYSKSDNNQQKYNIRKLRFEDISKITNLEIDRCYIQDSSFLGELNKLDSLTLTLCNIKDYSFLNELKGLKGLFIYLHKGDTFDLNHIKEISTLNKLNTLVIRRGIIKNLEIIRELDSLKEIDLKETKLTTVEFLIGLKNLEYVDVSNNQIGDISGLSNLINLKELIITNNQVSDLIPIRNLKNLVRFEAGANKIWDISPIVDLNELEVLKLFKNKIENLEGIGKLSRLKQLSLFSNKIILIQPIIDLEKIEVLDLSYNKIKDLSCLTGLKNPKIISIIYCSFDYKLIDKIKSKLKNVRIFSEGYSFGV